MSWIFINLIKAALLPPLNLLLLGLVGLVLIRSRPRLGYIMLLSSVALLWLCSTSYIAGTASNFLEASLKPIYATKYSANGIVVLGDGAYFNAPEYDEKDTVSTITLMRLRYASELWHKTGKPILVVSGSSNEIGVSQAQQMKLVLEKEFLVPVSWEQGGSENLFKTAKYCYQLLRAKGIDHIYLVTHALKMPRSIKVFQAAGFTVEPAPLYFGYYPNSGVMRFIPNSENLENLSAIIDEFIEQALLPFDLSNGN